MAEIGIKELKNTASRVIEGVEAGDRVVVTKRGRPVAVIVSIDEAEDFVLAHAEEFVRMRLDGRRARGAGKSAPFFDRAESVRRRQLREDAGRPGGELLDEAMSLSAFATELRAGARRARG